MTFSPPSRSVNFVGNLEGRDLAKDVADVYVTDGFTGNVVLKTSEGHGPDDARDACRLPVQDPHRGALRPRLVRS